MWSRSGTEPAGDGVVVPLCEAHLYSRRHSSTLRVPTVSGDTSNTKTVDDDVQNIKDISVVDEETALLETAAEEVPEYSIEGLRSEARRGSRATEMRTEYELKSRLINKAIQDIGMGKYNWQLFFLCGFGWFADNLWIQAVSLTLPSLSAEFDITEKSVRYTTSSLFVGLCLGSSFWGVGSDIMGRRTAFNLTLLIAGMFGTAAAWAPTWVTVCVAYSAMGFGVGGNLPVDGALFVEFLPDASGSLLTLLSVWWPIGQLCASLLAWLLVAQRPAAEGWRLFIASIGLATLAMSALRILAFDMLESPKYLLAQGRQADAVAAVHGVALRNGTKTWLTEDILDAVAADVGEGQEPLLRLPLKPPPSPGLTTEAAIQRNLAAFSADRIRPLFSSYRLAMTALLIWLAWAAIGMGYPLFNAFLPQYLSHGHSKHGGIPAADTYLGLIATSLAGLPGSLLAAYAVDSPSPLLGRRGTLALSSFASALLLFLFAAVGNDGRLPLVLACAEALTQSVMYGVLYAFTAELFAAPVRGSAAGVAGFLNRAMGLLAPIIAAKVPGDGTAVPVYLSAALIMLASMAVWAIPVETRDQQRL